MNYAKKEIICILFIMFTISCEKNITKLINTDDSYKIADIKNFVWTLESYEINGQLIDLSSYEPFHLVYDDSLFFGDDGCNQYGGIYETNGNSVIPADFWITEIACTNINTFTWLHLTKPYRYDILFENSEMMLYQSNSRYTYRSNFLENADSLLIDKTWSLKSNELVKLAFDKTRVFEAKYDCDNMNNSGCGIVGGIYGIGAAHTILFYETNSSGSGIKWHAYLKKLLSSSSYSIKDSLLILSNESDSTTFEFMMME